MASKKSRKSSARSNRRSPSNAFALLQGDHREVDAMLKQFERARSNSKRAIAERICAALTVHAQIEEEIFYPSAREVLGPSDQDLLEEAKVEHASLKNLIGQIQSADDGDSEAFAAKVTVLGEYTKHHVKEEEKELFPKLRKAGLDATEVGERLAARKQELMGQRGEPDRTSVRTRRSESSGLLGRMASRLGATTSK